MIGEAAAAFDPLAEGEIAQAAPIDSKAEWRPIIPVPKDAPRQLPAHSFGKPSLKFPYRDAEGRLLLVVCRFKRGNGKEYLPLTYCRGEDGRCEWRWQGPPKPAPLFGLDRLAKRPDAPVLLVEGEKKCAPAEALFPEYVAVAWQGGSKAIKHAELSPLAGRNIIAWPDNDAPGVEAMRDAARLLHQADAASVRLVELPSTWPAKWDLADELPTGATADDLRRLLETASLIEPPPAYVSFGQFKMTERGLHLIVPAKDVDDADLEVWLCDALEVLAENRDGGGENWGVLLRWRDHDDLPHRYALPRAALAGDGADARRILMDGGLSIDPKKPSRDRLTEYLTSVRTDRRARAVKRCGWQEAPDGRGPVYVLPDRTIGKRGREETLLQVEGAQVPALACSSTAAAWRDHVAALCAGNSRLILAVSSAFAAPLLRLVNEDSGGINLVGSSRSGKSTALKVAASVWGNPSVCVLTWRATANGLEAVAAQHSDRLLILDELSQVDPKEAGEIAYMLSNERGKSRARRDGQARHAATWRLLYVSSGEVGLADKLGEVGRKARAGQEVRLVDVPADAGRGLGLFDELHGSEGAEAFAGRLKDAALRYHGSAAVAYLEELAGKLAFDADGLRTRIRSTVEEFLAIHAPKDSSGQALSVARRFALIAAGGQIATGCGLTGWADDAAFAAAGACFRAWLDGRGGAGEQETATVISQVRAFLEAHGDARFADLENLGERVVHNRAGWRRVRDGKTEFLILPETWRKEICKGNDPGRAARALADAGWLSRGEEDRLKTKIHVPGVGKVRVFVIRGLILGGDHGE